MIRKLRVWWIGGGVWSGPADARVQTDTHGTYRTYVTYGTTTVIIRRA